MPAPLQPPDEGHEGKWRAKAATPEELDDAMLKCGLTGNAYLNDSQRHTMRQLLAYTWHMYDPILRPVESPPVGVQFMDPMQTPIKIPAYRSNAVKLAFMKDMIQEWLRDGIIKPADSPC